MPHSVLRLHDDMLASLARIRGLEGVVIQQICKAEIVLAIELQLAPENGCEAALCTLFIGQIAAASSQSGRFAPTMMFSSFVVPLVLAECRP